MIDKRNFDTKNLNWKLLNEALSYKNYNYIQGLNSCTSSDSIEYLSFSNNDYILEEFDTDSRFIAMVDVPTHCNINRVNSNCHLFYSNSIILGGNFDLSKETTWQMMWDKGINFFDFTDNILYVLSANDWFYPLLFYIDKLKMIKKEKLDMNEVVTNILRGAIPNNNIDIVNHVKLDLCDDFTGYGLTINGIQNITSLAMKPNVKPDYCYQMIRLLIDTNYFNSPSNKNITLETTSMIFKTMGHIRIYSLLKKYMLDLNNKK